MSSPHDRGGCASNQPPGEPARFASFGLATLLDLFENDSAAIAGLLAAALASIEKDAAAIGRSEPNRDRHAIVEAAHRIKGTSGSIGAQRLITISSQIETLLTRTADPIDAASLGELHVAVAALRAEVARYMGSLDA